MNTPSDSATRKRLPHEVIEHMRDQASGMRDAAYMSQSRKADTYSNTAAILEHYETVFNRFVKHIYDKELARADQLRAAVAGYRRDAERRELTNVQLQATIQECIGFEFQRGELQQVNAADLIKIGRAVAAAALANLGSGDGKEETK